MATEASLWAWLRRAIFDLEDLLHIRRVENAVGLGDPDADGCFDGCCFTAELKVAPRPSRAGRLRWGHEPTLAQVEWAEARLRAGGAAAFLLQVGSHPEAKRYVLAGNHGRRLMEGVTESELASIATLVQTPVDAIKALTLCSTNGDL